MSTGRSAKLLVPLLGIVLAVLAVAVPAAAHATGSTAPPEGAWTGVAATLAALGATMPVIAARGARGPDARIRAVLDGLTVPAALVDADLRVAATNREFDRLAGGAATGRPVADALPDCGAAPWVEEVLATGRGRNGLRLPHGEGALRVSLRPVPVGPGGTRMVLLVAEDLRRWEELLDRLRAAEAELRRVRGGVAVA